ncbi:MAG: FIST N-terminal domain-containing protein [Acidimicrobiia bacterium]
MRFRQSQLSIASGVSEHPIPTHAIGEALGSVLENIKGRIDLALVTVTLGFGGALGDMCDTVAAITTAKVVVGVVGSSIVGGAHEIEDRPAVAVWALSGASVELVRIETQRRGAGWLVSGIPKAVCHSPRLLALFADPQTFPASQFGESIRRICPQLRVVGGRIAPRHGFGQARFSLNGSLYSDGAVGVLFPAEIPIKTRVAQGTKALGEPLVVTKSQDARLIELAGKPAVQRMRELLEALEPRERAKVASNLYLGRVLDENQLEYDSNNFVTQRVMGADPTEGILALRESLDVGQIVQFHVPDAHSADANLRNALDGITGKGALLFNSAARGSGLFGYPDHDAAVVASAIESNAVGGVFTVDEFGRNGNTTLLHRGTTSVVVFGD